MSYYVAASRTPRVFNLGGDLALFVDADQGARPRRARAATRGCASTTCTARIQNFRCPTLTTISLVQGDALGGGFECALSSDVIVAEESAQMGLPEILFNLFPGMGAYSLLARRIGMRAAEELILSGKILTAAELHEMGIVDVLATDGQGETAVRNWIAKNAKRRNGMQAVFARAPVHPSDHARGARRHRRAVGGRGAAPARARPEDDGPPGARADAPHGAARARDRRAGDARWQPQQRRLSSARLGVRCLASRRGQSGEPARRAKKPKWPMRRTPASAGVNSSWLQREEPRVEGHQALRARGGGEGIVG